MGRKKAGTPPACASCKLEGIKKACMTREGAGPANCPTLTRKKTLDRSNREYESPDVRELARQASIQEGECYANRHQRPYVMQPSKTRMEEIVEFSRKMKYRRLGLAFCIGLAREASVVDEILRTKGFEVISILCKAGRVPKEQIGIKNEEKIFRGTEESMCNPIFQARLLNEEKTDLNILIGLCVGHDSLFFKYAKAPTTVLAVKDRVTGHNPLAPIYLSTSYYQKLRHPETS
jgi:uncharacterized metal-binding protein